MIKISSEIDYYSHEAYMAMINILQVYLNKEISLRSRMSIRFDHKDVETYGFILESFL